MDELVEWLKKMLRIKSDTADEELEDLVRACQNELKIAGVQGKLTDPLYEKFLNAFQGLRDSMALSGDYKET